MSYRTPQSSRVVVDLNNSIPQHSPHQSHKVPMQHFSNPATHIQNTNYHQSEPSSRWADNEEYLVELRDTSTDPSAQKGISKPPERPRTPPFQPKKPSEHPINIATLIHRYDNDISPMKNKPSTVERPSLSPEAQHKYATIRALFENLTDENRVSSSKNPPRSQTAPVVYVRANKAATCEPRLLSPTTSEPSNPASEQLPQGATKRYGTRHAPPVESPTSAFEQDSSPTEYSFLSSVTASPYDDPFLRGAELRDEGKEQYSHAQAQKGSQTQEMPERMNLKDLFDSLQVSPTDDEAAGRISPNCRATAETTSTVARLIEKYGRVGEDIEQTMKTNNEAVWISQERDKRQEEEQPDRLLVLEDEDEIQKVYKTDNNPVQYRSDGISQREGGVEAIPWEVRLKSFNRDGAEAIGRTTELKSSEKSEVTAAHERVKSFSLYSGSDQHSKPRSRSDTRGRRWHTRHASALNKSWIGKVARQQAHKVKRQVGTMRNMISADDY